MRARPGRVRKFKCKGVAKRILKGKVWHSIKCFLKLKYLAVRNNTLQYKIKMIYNLTSATPSSQ